jgi:aryl-alcohol dehydrogenase-like predicted oxidoreductase
MLSGIIRSRQDLQPGDWRLTAPRFAEQALEANVALVERTREIAARKGITPAQLALAWLLAKGDVLPIPGTRRPERLAENLAAANVELSADDLAQLEEVAPGVGVGERYPEAGMKAIDR